MFDFLRWLVFCAALGANVFKAALKVSERGSPSRGVTDGLEGGSAFSVFCGAMVRSCIFRSLAIIAQTHVITIAKRLFGAKTLRICLGDSRSIRS
jgi:hypothetical protein